MNDEKIANEVERIHQLGVKGKNIECFQESKTIKKLIEQARASVVNNLKENLKLAGWHEGMSIHQEQEMGDYRRGQIDVMHWLERRIVEENPSTRKTTATKKED